MVFGPAGSCKSMFAMAWVLSLKIPTLVYSPDTDAHDQAIRVMANLHQMSTDTVEQGVAVGALDMNDDLAALRPWLQWCFDPSLTLDDLDLELRAYEEVHGGLPELIVVDTLSDVHANDEDEFGGMRRTMAALHHIARETGAAVLVVHHTTGQYDSDVAPAERKAINGKVSKTPELILSVARNGAHLGVAVVKQRSGYSDPTAATPIWLAVDPARATISDPPDAVYAGWSDDD